jgi:6-pyruvoyltetrahydropterin/6-carboxytetrahydropterin synthase
MYELSITSDFSSAHFLRGYDGSCQNLHGHTWKLEVTIRSDKLDDIGLVFDFREMKKRLKEFLTPLDHTCLNDLPAFKQINPSSENLAKYIYHEFAKQCHPFKLKQVRVWESDTASVTYYENE